MNRIKTFLTIVMVWGGLALTPSGVQAVAPTVTLGPAQQQISAGQSANISWTISGAATCTASDSTGWSSPWQTTGGSISVAPTSSATYYLECWDAGGLSSGKKSAQVLVGPSLTLSPQSLTVSAGESVTISWNSTGDICAFGDGTIVSFKPKSDSVTVTPTTSTKYYVTCYTLLANGSYGPQSPTRVSDITVIQGVSCTYNADVSWLGNCGTMVNETLASGQSKTIVNTRPGFTGTATFTCNNATFLGPFDTTCQAVAAVLPVIESLTATPSTISSNSGTTTLKWTVKNATKCKTFDDWLSGPIMSMSDSIVKYIEKDSTFTMECYDDKGAGSGKKSVTVKVGGSNNTCVPDNSCAANTCSTTTCTNNCNQSVPGTKNCAGGGGNTCVPNNACAANTCTTATCVNNCNQTIPGTKNCGAGGGGGNNCDNSCAANTCSTTTCTNSCGVFVVGTKNCGAASTCLAAGNVCHANCPAGWQQVTGTCDNNQDKCCSLLPVNNAPTSSYFNPLKFDSVEGVLTALLGQLRNIIVILSIIFIIIGSVMYILSGGNESRLNMAKAAITAALIGLAIALAAPSFLKEIAELLGWTNVNNAQVTGAQSFTEIAGNVLNFLLALVGILAIIMLVIGGFVYLTAAGDEKRAETGKKIVTYAIIAIAVALSALVLVTQVTKFFV